MSYSDYGSYNWQKEIGEWIYKPEFEDRSLITPQRERVLEKATGLKFDAVIQSQINDKDFENLPFSVKHTHHSVIGDLNGFAVVSYKGTPVVLWKGEEVDSIEYDDVDEEDWDAENEVVIKKENFEPKRIHIVKDEDHEVKVLIDNKDNFWSIAYVRNGNDEFIGMCGYGLGKHWWLDEDGDELDWENHLGKNDEYGKKTPIEHWPREKECLNRALSLLSFC